MLLKLPKHFNIYAIYIINMLKFLRRIASGFCLNTSVILITSLIIMLILNHYYSYNYLFETIMKAGDSLIPLLLDKTNLTAPLLELYQLNQSNGINFNDMHHDCEVYGVPFKGITSNSLPSLPCFTCESLLKFNNGSECVINYRNKIEGINSINTFLTLLSDFCEENNSFGFEVPCLNCQDLKMYSKPEQCLNQTFYSLYTNNVNNTLTQGISPFNSTISLELINNKTRFYSKLVTVIILFLLGIAFLFSVEKREFPKAIFKKLFASFLFSGVFSLTIILLFPKIQEVFFSSLKLSIPVEMQSVMSMIFNALLRTPLIALTIINFIIAIICFSGFLILKFTLNKKSKK